MITAFVRRGKFYWAFWVLCLLTVGDWGAVAQSQTAGEDEIKSALIYNFVKFITWPDASFKNPNEPFLICMMTEDRSSNMMKASLKDKEVKGRVINVALSDDVQSLKGCQVFFISSSQNAKAAEVLSKIKSKYLLTIGESDGFAKSGGIIGLYKEGGKLRFEINVEAADRADLKISSKLLSLGTITKNN